MNYYPNLHSLRGIAAIWVMLFHIWIYSGSKVGFLSPFYNMGWVGVHLFYILSAFLLGSIYFHKKKTNQWNIKAFYKKRFLRIFPAYYFQFLIILISTFFFSTYNFPSIENLIAHLFIFFNLPPLFIQQLNGVWWTLPIEFSYYLIMPFAIIVLEKIGYKLFLILSIVITVGFRYLVFNEMAGSPVQSISIYIGQLPGVFIIFSLGLIAAYLQHHNKFSISVKQVILAFILSILWSKLLLVNIDDYWKGSFLLYIWEGINSLLILIIILGTYKLKNSLLSFPFFIWLGKISYGIYLWHLPVIFVLKNHIHSFNYLLLTSLPLTILFASISYYCIENKFTKPK